MNILTVGHSNRTLEFLVSLLLGYDVARLIDVRTVPRSRHNPQFNRESLPENLSKAKIAYTHMTGLGGLRRALKDSVNTGWVNASFRGYADYMQTTEFERSLKGLISRARKESVCIMCAEAVPWRCHRSLIADALTVRGIEVRHIMSRISAPLHRVTPWAKIKGTRLTYPNQSVT